MYERRTQKPLTRNHFVRRLISHVFVAILLVVGSMLAGMIGYHLFEGLNWLDGFLNASMLLGGMGPVDPPHTDGGKLFAGLYALYAGLVFLIAAGLMVAPVFHRMLHLFHWQDDKKN